MKHYNELKEAYDLIEENETRAFDVSLNGEKGLDICHNVMQGQILTRYLLDRTYELEGIKKIIEQQRIVRNKLRLALFAPDIDNVEINKLVNGNFINYT